MCLPCFEKSSEIREEKRCNFHLLKQCIHRLREFCTLRCNRGANLLIQNHPVFPFSISKTRQQGCNIQSAFQTAVHSSCCVKPPYEAENNRQKACRPEPFSSLYLIFYTIIYVIFYVTFSASQYLFPLIFGSTIPIK